jgi:hypothetical protein
MSTNFITEKQIQLSELLEGRLEKYNVCEHVNEETSKDRRCLTDGTNYLWVWSHNGYAATSFTRYGGNAVNHILSSIFEEFDTNIYSEYQCQYWGFNSDEEWTDWMNEQSKSDNDKFYEEIVRFVTEQGCDFKTGTIGMIKAEIAKKLVSRSPELLLMANRDRLMDDIENSYNSEHAVSISLSQEEIETVKSTMNNGLTGSPNTFDFSI